MIKALGTLLSYALIGALFAVGIKAVEWLIPKPGTRVIICWADDIKDKPMCMPLQNFAKEPTP